MIKYTKYLLCISTLTLTVGCATTTVLYKSDPPGATISGPTVNGGNFLLNTPTTISYPTVDAGNGICKEIITPLTRWPDGTTLDPANLRLCHRSSEWVLVKPSPARTFKPDIPAKVPTDIDEAKAKCSQLGFKAGTEAFGNCVLRLSR